MSCNINSEVWFDYVEDELDPSFKKDLNVHLKECQGCQKNYAEFRMTRRILAKEEIKMPSDGAFSIMTDKIMAAIEKGPGMERGGGELAAIRLLRPSWVKYFAIPVAAAAALVFFVAGGLFTTPSFNGDTSKATLARQDKLTDQMIEQTESGNPQQLMGNTLVTGQDEDDMVLDAAAAKLSHMSDTEARTMLDNMK